MSVFTVPRIASADGRVSVVTSVQTVMESSGGADVLGDVGVGYDLGPPPSVRIPARVRLDFDYDFPTAAYNSDMVVSGGLSVRATTPLYFGAGVSIDSIRFGFSGAEPASASIEPIGIGLVCCSNPYQSTTTGIGSKFFVGQKIVDRPGFGLAIEASYRLFPSLADQAQSGLAVGLRTSFL